MKALVYSGDMRGISCYSDSTFKKVVIEQKLVDPKKFYMIPTELFTSEVENYLWDGYGVFFKLRADGAIDKESGFPLVEIDHVEAPAVREEPIADDNSVVAEEK